MLVNTLTDYRKEIDKATFLKEMSLQEENCHNEVI